MLLMALLPLQLPAKGWVSSPFGFRTDPFSRRAAFHAGVDIANQYATGVSATKAGTASFSGKRKGYGRLVILNHDDGSSTYYAHLGRIFVSEGETVSRGQTVGWMGLTGRTTGSHVHYEIRRFGIPVNPLSEAVPPRPECRDCGGPLEWNTEALWSTLIENIEKYF
jgi:murein DD-endopeptidase MepM/ murein hydrolase activator NlpD